MKPRLVILGGGDSPEREVSLRSAAAVAAAAKSAGYSVAEADPANGFSILDGLPQSTIILPILHGKGGEDGSIQAEMERRDLIFLGAGSKVSELCFDKWRTRQVLEQAGLPIPLGGFVTRDTYGDSQLAKRPHVLKINHGGSSIGTLIVRQPDKLEPSEINELFDMEKEAVIEELVEGIEVTVPILDQSALPPIEIHPPEHGEFDYENKYNGKSQELCPPPSLTQGQIDDAKKLAENVHRAVACRHLSRVDFIMRPDGSFVVLEINTIPGMTDQSLYPKAAAVAGISMSELVRRFVDMAVRDSG